MKVYKSGPSVSMDAHFQPAYQLQLTNCQHFPPKPTPTHTRTQCSLLPLSSFRSSASLALSPPPPAAASPPPPPPLRPSRSEASSREPPRTTTRAVTPVHVVTTTVVSPVSVRSCLLLDGSCSRALASLARVLTFPDNDWIVAVNAPQQGGSCGRKVKITNTKNGKTATALAADTCTFCPVDYRSYG